jgi:hypothetical protein
MIDSSQYENQNVLLYSKKNGIENTSAVHWSL